MANDEISHFFSLVTYDKVFCCCAVCVCVELCKVHSYLFLSAASVMSCDGSRPTAADSPSVCSSTSISSKNTV